MPSSRRGRVGIIDTGIDPQRAQGWISKSATISLCGFDIKPGLGDYEELDHGTDMANSIWRIAPEVEVVSVAALNAGAVIARTALAFDWLLTQNVDVILCAFGFAEEVWALNDLISAAVDRDVLVVGAAGNCGAGRMLSPGRFADVLSVGLAASETRVGRISGSLASGQGQRRALPHIVTDLHEDDVLGTSAATARIAGFAASFRRNNPSLHARDVAYAICHAAKKLDPCHAHRAGFGYFDAETAPEKLSGAPSQKNRDFSRLPSRHICANLVENCRRVGPASTVTLLVGTQKTLEGARLRRTLSQSSVRITALGAVPINVVELAPVQALDLANAKGVQFISDTKMDPNNIRSVW